MAGSDLDNQDPVFGPPAVCACWAGSDVFGWVPVGSRSTTCLVGDCSQQDIPVATPHNGVRNTATDELSQAGHGTLHQVRESPTIGAEEVAGSSPGRPDHLEFSQNARVSALRSDC